MRTLSALLILFALSAAPARAETGDKPFSPEAGFTLDEAGLRKVADAIRSDARSLERLRPDYAVCRTLAVKESTAIRLFHHSMYETEWLVKNLKAPAQSEIRVSSWSVDAPAPEQFARLAKVVEDFRGIDRYWSIVVVDENEKGWQLGYFVVHGNRWVLLPRPESMAQEKSLPSDVTALFIGMVKTGDLDTAYGLLSKHIREQATPAQFASLIPVMGIQSLKKISPRGRLAVLALGKTFTRRTYLLELTDGQQGVLTLYTQFDGENSTITFMDYYASLGIGGASMFLPDADTCRTLALSAMTLVAETFRSGDIGPLVAVSTKELRDELTPERFRETFASHLENAELFGFVSTGTVEWTKRPQIQPTRDEHWERRNLLDEAPRGPLVLRGDIVAKDGSKRMPFLVRYEFQPKDDKWLIQGFTVEAPR